MNFCVKWMRPCQMKEWRWHRTSLLISYTNLITLDCSVMFYTLQGINTHWAGCHEACCPPVQHGPQVGHDKKWKTCSITAKPFHWLVIHHLTSLIMVIIPWCPKIYKYNVAVSTTVCINATQLSEVFFSIFTYKLLCRVVVLVLFVVGTDSP